jgi:hypothetical protein
LFLVLQGPDEGGQAVDYAQEEEGEVDKFEGFKP